MCSRLAAAHRPQPLAPPSHAFTRRLGSMASFCRSRLPMQPHPLGHCVFTPFKLIMHPSQEGNPSALLKANQVLIDKEGAAAAQPLAGAGDAGGGGGGLLGAGGALGALAGIPAMHPVLTSALDLVESKGEGSRDFRGAGRLGCMRTHSVAACG